MSCCLCTTIFYAYVQTMKYVLHSLKMKCFFCTDWRHKTSSLVCVSTKEKEKMKLFYTYLKYLKDKCQDHSKPKGCLVLKEFLSIHQILHPESIDLSTQRHTESLSSDSAIWPTKKIEQMLDIFKAVLAANLTKCTVTIVIISKLEISFRLSFKQKLI